MNYQGKKVLILGLGINQGGVGAARFFAKAGAQVKVTDLKTEVELKDSLDELQEYSNIEYILGEHRYEDLDWADLIIRNPALKPDNPYLQYAKEHNKRVEMDLGIFLEEVAPDRIIGVTGTKGKSTTASLIHFALAEQGVKIVLAGNIGKSMLDLVGQVAADSYIVLELSSFQLQALESHPVSPRWSVVTNIYPDHLNYHKSMEEYVQTKRLICAYQDKGDYVFLNMDNEHLTSPAFTEGLKGQIIFFSDKDLPEDYALQYLVGDHNRANVACALAVAKVFGLDPDKSLEVLKEFKGVDFRMQLIKEYKGVRIYNDTTATMPQAAVDDVKSMPDAIVIAGGMDKGLPYEALAQTLDQYAKSVYFLVGDATDKMASAMKEKEKVRGQYDNLETLLKDVLTEAKEGDTVLFCPGATSFNLFQNEFDRGRQFNAVVEKLTS